MEAKKRKKKRKGTHDRHERQKRQRVMVLIHTPFPPSPSLPSLFVFALFRTGYDSLVSTRSDLLQLLVSQIPPHKIHFSKRIISFSANKDEVVIRCADDTTFRGDVLIGADGAFSKVRELLYKQVAKKGILPRQDAVAVAADMAAATIATAAALLDDGSSETVTAEAEGEALKGGHIHLVGVTRALDVEKFGVLLEDDSRCEIVVGNTLPHTVSTLLLNCVRA